MTQSNTGAAGSALLGLGLRAYRSIRYRLGKRLLRPFEPAATPSPAVPEQERSARDRYVQRQGFILTDLVCAALPQGDRFTVLDGGAREAAQDLRWRGYDRRRLRFYGFEIDPEECAKLNAESAGGALECTYYSTGLWSAPGTRAFYLTSAAGGSSLYAPNYPLTDRLKLQDPSNILLLRDAMKIDRSFDVPVDALDNIVRQHGLRPIDFIKLNIQGAELEVLRGATETLKPVLGLQMEIAFAESYVGRPLFSDLDPVARAAGFTFFDLVGPHYTGRAASPITARHLPGLHGLYGHLFEGHGLYLRDPIELERRGADLDWVSRDSLLKLASLAETYHQVEFAFEVLAWGADYLARRGDAAGAGDLRRLHEEGASQYRRYMA